MTLPDISCSHQNTGIQGDMLLLEDFCFTYKDGKHGINIPRLELPTNRIIAIIGHNGAGKSTLARNICGLERRCKGILTMNGKKLKTKDRLHSCYMIMQDVNHQLFTESVRDEVMLSIRFVKSKSLSAEESVTRRENLVLCRDCFSVTAAAGRCGKQAQGAADISADTTTASAKTIAQRTT